jgi:RNA recognition motif-containing protein
MMLIVNNLHPSSTPHSLVELFRPFGKVLWSRLILDMNGHASALAYVEMALLADATKAVEALDGTLVLEQLIRVAFTSDIMQRRAH